VTSITTTIVAIQILQPKAYREFRGCVITLTNSSPSIPKHMYNLTKAYPKHHNN
jgi:hypothetical protein